MSVGHNAMKFDISNYLIDLDAERKVPHRELYYAFPPMLICIFNQDSGVGAAMPCKSHLLKSLSNFYKGRRNGKLLKGKVILPWLLRENDFFTTTLELEISLRNLFPANYAAMNF